MATNQRIYLVAPKRADNEAAPVVRRLVRAAHPANALRHVAADEYSVTVATQDDLVALLSDGAKVEEIKGEQQVLPT